jgi:hypothetical protein
MMKMLIQQLPMREIHIPTGQRKLGHLNDLVVSIGTVGLLQPIVVNAKASGHQLIAGRHMLDLVAAVRIPAASQGRRPQVVHSDL